MPLTIFSRDLFPGSHVVSVLLIAFVSGSNSVAGPDVVAGGAVVDTGGPAVVPCPAVVDTTGSAVVVAGGATVVVSGSAEQLKPATSLSVTNPPNFLVFQPQTRLFHRGQAQIEVMPPKLAPLATMSSPLEHL